MHHGGRSCRKLTNGCAEHFPQDVEPQGAAGMGGAILDPVTPPLCQDLYYRHQGAQDLSGASRLLTNPTFPPTPHPTTSSKSERGGMTLPSSCVSCQSGALRSPACSAIRNRGGREVGALQEMLSFLATAAGMLT